LTLDFEHVAPMRVEKLLLLSFGCDVVNLVCLRALLCAGVRRAQVKSEAVAQQA
jgi:hypothetical protein